MGLQLRGATCHTSHHPVTLLCVPRLPSLLSQINWMNSSEERSSTELLANKTVASSLRFPSQVSNQLWIIVKLHVSRHGVNLMKLYPALAPAPAPCNYHCLWLEPEWRERIPLAPAGADYLFVLSCTGDSSQLVSIWLIISPLTHGNPNHQQHHQHYFYPFQSSSKCRV